MSYKDYTYGKDYWIDNIYHVGKRKGGISIFGHSIKYHEDTKIWYTARFEGSSAGIDLDPFESIQYALTSAMESHKANMNANIGETKTGMFGRHEVWDEIRDINKKEFAEVMKKNILKKYIGELA